MAVSQSTALRNAELDNGPGGTTFDRMILYTGAPVGAGAAQTGTVLATFTLNATPFPAASAGTITANAIADVTAAATGTAASFLLYKSTQTNANTSVPAAADKRLNGTVLTSGGDLTIDNAALVSGQTVHISSLAITAPA